MHLNEIGSGWSCVEYRSLDYVYTQIPSSYKKHGSCDLTTSRFIKREKERALNCYRANFSEALERGLPSATSAAPHTAAPAVAHPGTATATVHGLLVGALAPERPPALQRLRLGHLSEERVDVGGGGLRHDDGRVLGGGGGGVGGGGVGGGAAEAAAKNRDRRGRRRRRRRRLLWLLREWATRE